MDRGSRMGRYFQEATLGHLEAILDIIAVLMFLAPSRGGHRLPPVPPFACATAPMGWTGLRGAAPIVFATFPVLAGLPKAHDMFSIVFFVVILSALFQRTTLARLTNKLKLTEPDKAIPA